MSEEVITDQVVNSYFCNIILIWGRNYCTPPTDLVSKELFVQPVPLTSSSLLYNC